MSLVFNYDYCPAGNPTVAISNNGTLLFGYGTSVYSLALSTGKLNWTSGSTANTPYAMCFLNAASALLITLNAFYDFIELSGGYTTSTLKSSYALYQGEKSQQVAANPNGIAIVGIATNNSIVQVVASSFAITAITPSAGSLTGAQAAAVINKTGTNNFIIGTNTGNLIEVDQNGVTIQTVTLPTTPNVGTAPVHLVTGLSYYNDMLLAITNFGIAFHYKWSTSTLLGKYMLGAAYGNVLYGATLCDSASGVCILSQTGAADVPSWTIQIDFGYSPILIEPFFTDEYSYGPIAAGIDATTNTAWLAGGSYTGATSKIKVCNITGLGQSAESTRIQNSGTDVSGRVIRILNKGVGNSRVEIDQTVSAGSTSIQAESGSNYIEIALTGTAFVNEQGDVRWFDT